MSQEFWKNKRVLVTGADGFVGSHFVEQLSISGANVVGTVLRKSGIDASISSVAEMEEADILDANRFRDLCKKHDIALILHCAALDGNADFKMKNSARIMDENMRMVSNVLNTAKDLGISDVMVMSSAEIYSPKVQSPITEEDDYQRIFNYSENGYVLSKIFAEVLAKLYSKQFGIRTYLPRPTNIYGPRDRFDDVSNRVIPSMIRKAMNGESIEIWGDGSQVRGFIYVKDLVWSILAMVENGSYQSLNIATGESISILDLAKLVSETVGVEPNIHLDSEKSGGMKERILDDDKLLGIINFKFEALSGGLAETIQWYREIFRTH